jgi:hypothetical protein
MRMTENPYASPHAALEVAKPQQFLHGLSSAAIGLLTISLIELLFNGLMFVPMLLRFAAKPTSQTLAAVPLVEIMMLTAAFACFVKAAIAFAGAICMRKRVKYKLALTGAFASSFSLVLIPLWFSAPDGSQQVFMLFLASSALFGIWALTVLLRKQTRAAFAASKHRS